MNPPGWRLAWLPLLLLLLQPLPLLLLAMPSQPPPTAKPGVPAKPGVSASPDVSAKPVVGADPVVSNELDVSAEPEESVEPPFRCFAPTEAPLIGPVALVPCEEDMACHEYFYAYQSSRNIVYKAGCGAVIPVFNEDPRNRLLVNKVHVCANDSCNTRLRSELMQSNRVCSYAVASRVVGNRTVACLPEESRCYFEAVNSPVPFYHAGCGTCPPYTLTCVTCTVNHCNRTSDEPVKPWRPEGAKLLIARGFSSDAPMSAPAPAPSAFIVASAAAAACCLVKWWGLLVRP